jgi:precorrin-8X/cobalt-precorrin-8 methylmutase
MSPTLFDRYIAVDWSANNEPKLGKDSIWAATAVVGNDNVETVNLSTRRQAEAWQKGQPVDAVARRGRVLVGLDIPYGYPAGFAAALGVEASWIDVWRYLTDQVEDNAQNSSNRFEVAAGINQMLGADAPFWGRPATQPNAYLAEKKTVTYGLLSEWRQAERTLHGVGLYPQSVWKLAYAGSVGSQALLGIPVVHRLRWDSQLQAVSLVWPFEITVPSIPAGRPGVVHAEIWPSVAPFDHELGRCPDEQQVRAVVRLWQDQDQRQTLGEMFAAVPADEEIRREEGWILGIDSTGSGARLPTPSARRSAPRQRERGLHPCECGCGLTGPGRFRPGHDAKLRSQLMKAVAGGDERARAKLAELGW